ncbi:uncharacterized protein TRIADDRAFT_22091 [Trichoplax adhaerens]|uniref:TRUD domain-containing protein n=1 Tax=Trichoplax adhaerens TaxID=10228 RepID=B3RRZ1_TRIAD|nr:hypothetical protein TRIADDRAFT_22091 [Trichoplax adhaerens]EDV26432.1 hypothetical protein TRIADDRAFT_22091 [Trichoplax adhaerens]|eukprot:XP_002110428.1 hypothetical protein TRIADDRAFT_22091 [Trichoplax adhaerens]
MLAQTTDTSIASDHQQYWNVDVENFEEINTNLANVITEQQLQSLQQLAHQHHQADSEDSHHQIIIGLVQDKSKRTIIRQSISLLYPNLQTVLQCQNGDKIIIVEPNPNYNQLKILLPEHQVDGLLRFISKVHITKCGHYTIDVHELDKDQRRQLHHRISHLFGKFIESKTIAKVNKNDKTSKNCIIVRYKSRIRNRYYKDKDNNDNPLYLKFILRKRNVETLDAIHKIAKALGCHLSDFSYAGIKDCRAITYQQVTVKNVKPQQMINALQKIKSQEHIQYGNYQFIHTPIRLGQLKGNRFRILLRDIRLQDHDSSLIDIADLHSQIIQSMEEVKKQGFINYFGNQRFGKTISTVNSYDIGLAMLRRDEKMAVELILSTVDEDISDNATMQALKYYHTSGDLVSTLKKIPSYKSRVYLILKALHRYGQNIEGYRKALLNIPHNMRKIYIHSYCSLLWNRLVNYRIEKYGYNVVEGDLVLLGNVDNKPDSTDTDAINQDQLVKLVTKTDLALNKYNIYDVVLPLLGSKTIYPSNTSGSVYKDMLANDGINDSSFVNPMLNIKIKGAYRKILSVPKDVNFSLHILNCQHLHDDCHDCCSNILKNQTCNSRFHFKLEMTLNPGSYATVCLREITNNDAII